MTDMEYTLDDKVLRKPPADPTAALAEALRSVTNERLYAGDKGGPKWRMDTAAAILAALDAAGFVLMTVPSPGESAGYDREQAAKAEIAEAVRRLPSGVGRVGSRSVSVVDRAAVLAIVKGETP